MVIVMLVMVIVMLVVSDGDSDISDGDSDISGGNSKGWFTNTFFACIVLQPEVYTK